jgi:hypothetical protein
MVVTLFGMTKVHCSSEGYLNPRGIYLRDEDLVDDQWIPQMDSWLMDLLQFI